VAHVEQPFSVMTKMSDCSTHPERLARIEQLARKFVELPPVERRDVALAYLFEVAELLTIETGSEAIISPMLEIIPFVADPAERPLFSNRRTERSAPSNAVLARASAAIDVLVSMGRTTDVAAQTVARQMVNARASLPETGGDVRGWKRLSLWRERLINLKKPSDAWVIYEDTLVEFARMHRAEVVRRALDGSLWDVRARAAETGSCQPTPPTLREETSMDAFSARSHLQR